VVDIAFHDQLTILTGANGAGKTTILNIISHHFGWQPTLISTPRKKSGEVVLLYPLRPQLSLQWWQDLTRAVVIESCRLVALEPACASAASHVRSIDPQLFLDDAGDQLSHLR